MTTKYEQELKHSKREDVHTPFSELCRYCDEFHLLVQLEKPFPEMNQMILRVLTPDEKELKKVIIEDVADINHQAGSVLNELSKKAQKCLT